MEPARATWTDERPDDFAEGMNRGFERIDRDIRELRAAMKSGDELLCAEMKSGDASIRTEMNARFDRLERMMHRYGGGLILTFAAAFLSLLFKGG